MDKRFPRGLVLTEKGLRAIGIKPVKLVPLLSIPYRDDEKDRRWSEDR